MREIESLLRREIGLDAASIGSALIERTIRHRMKEHNLKKTRDYRALLEHSRHELNELIENVVVTETWFFRDRAPFEAFRQIVVRECLPRAHRPPLRILSVPCSSGEEPYSIAMTLLDAHVTTEHFVIDAVDISTHALQRAHKATYGKNSFRAKCLAFRDRYFTPAQDGFTLTAAVKRCVNFHRENILDQGFLAGRAPYDFIFCRNLLIYFDRATQTRTLDKLHHLLAPDGVLFVGAAELPLVTEGGFVSANMPMAFACRKFNPGNRDSSSARLSKPARSMASAPTNTYSAVEYSKSHKPPSPARTGSILGIPSDLDAAQLLANAGELAEASAVCEEHIAEHGPTAQAYYLLGLIRDAAGESDATSFYRKAIYLDPGHHEALVHLALWLEKHGDIEGAQTFKRRASRLGEKTTTPSGK